MSADIADYVKKEISSAAVTQGTLEETFFPINTSVVNTSTKLGKTHNFCNEITIKTRDNSKDSNLL